MKTDDEKYKLKVVRGTFATDYWLFGSIEKADAFIVRTRGCAGGLVKAGTMEIWKKVKKKNQKRSSWKKVGER